MQRRRFRALEAVHQHRAVCPSRPDQVVDLVTKLTRALLPALALVGIALGTEWPKTALAAEQSGHFFAAPESPSRPEPAEPFLLPGDMPDSDEILGKDESQQLPPAASLGELVAGVRDLPRIVLDEDQRCLAVAIYFEARGEPLEGQLAVGQVIMNRVRSGQWGDSVCSVVNQPRQFSYTHDRRSDQPQTGYDWDVAKAIAMIAATDQWKDISHNATHFHATRVAPRWANMQRVARYGNHIFYRPRTRG